jgi:hypothetical protein
MEKKLWSKMTRAEKRVEIAKDALAHYKSKLFKPTKCTYLSVEDIDDEINENQQLNTFILKEKKTCNTCLKGAVLCSHILKTNHLSIQEFNKIENENDFIYKRLKGIFSVNQLDLMEVAFEGRVVMEENTTLATYNEDYDEDDWDEEQYILTELAEKAIKFSKKYENTDDRYVAILRNLIKNGGEFILK